MLISVFMRRDPHMLGAAAFKAGAFPTNAHQAGLPGSPAVSLRKLEVLASIRLAALTKRLHMAGRPGSGGGGVTVAQPSPSAQRTVRSARVLVVLESVS
jgi:hypothetical protein